MTETEQVQERVILIGVSQNDGDDTEASLKELEKLVLTAKAVAVEKQIQNREHPHPVTYLGKGKIEEIKERLWELDATGVVCDEELSPVQLRNLEESLDTKVMDRTMVILDIFAARASSREGKIQVELAQLKDRAARLVGMRKSLSRLGGGIGTRGPGEKKLEVDRRRIHERISHLKEELRGVTRHREVTRAKRERAPILTVALVGYTNAGKSTLLNAWTGADVLSEDKLFATLDPTTREFVLPQGDTVLLTDTVGFIRKLPHHLIEAFQSTLEEAKYADLLLHVVDASDPDRERQMQVVYETLRRLGIQGKPVFTLFNKTDVCPDGDSFRDFKADRSFCVSAKNGEGLEDVKEAISEVSRRRNRYVERVFSYEEAGKVQVIRKYGQLLSESYEEDGIHVAGYLPEAYYRRLTGACAAGEKDDGPGEEENGNFKI
ncbi:MAG: GTPase HflX [Lachnospiraceae bacterium]|nr:GTPase HflX [Lachnospiraceae bacterium]